MVASGWVAAIVDGGVLGGVVGNVAESGRSAGADVGGFDTRGGSRQPDSSTVAAQQRIIRRTTSESSRNPSVGTSVCHSIICGPYLVVAATHLRPGAPRRSPPLRPVTNPSHAVSAPIVAPRLPPEPVCDRFERSARVARGGADGNPHEGV